MSIPARYQVIRELGPGATGTVHEVYDHERGMRVALETVPELPADDVARCKREFRALSRFSHPSVIHLYDLIADDGQLCFTREIIEGEHLLAYVCGEAAPALAHLLRPDTRPAPSSEPVPLSERVDIERLGDTLAQLASALRALHAAGLIHGELTPASVMVTAAGRVVLMDFGLAGALRPAAGAAHPPAVAPCFVAPEQLEGAPPSPAADWYAFGVVLYLLLTGRLPFPGPTAADLSTQQQHDPPPPGTYATDVPSRLETLCLRLLARDPSQRPTADEVRAELAHSVPAVARSRRSARARRDSAADLFVGRSGEISLLHQSLARVAEHGLQCVLIAGPSGMGKSTLAARFAVELAQRHSGPGGPVVLVAHCHEREGLAYQALASIMDGLCLHLEEVPAAERPELTPRHVGLLARLFPVLTRLPEHEHADQSELAATAELRTQAVEALRELLAATARPRPLVLIIEDVQFADGDSFELLTSLLWPPAVPGLLLVLTARADAVAAPAPALARFLDTLSEHQGLRRITLGPLSTDEQQELAHRLGARQGGKLRVDENLWRASAGHPLLLAELVRYARSAPAEDLAVGAPGLEELLWQRASGLDGPGRALLEAVAVMGEPAPLPVLARVAGLAPAERDAALHALTAAQLARIARTDRDTWLDVYHATVRETVLGRLAPERLRDIHGLAAEAMEGWPEAPPAALAHHWMAAGAHDKAIDYLIKTARSSESKLALGRAASLYREAATLLDDAPRSPALDAGRVQAWLGLARGMRLGDRHDEAMSLLDRAEPLATELERDEDLAEVHYLRGNLLFPRGDLEGCMAEHQRALIHATRAGSRRLQACALGGLGDAHYLRGRIASAYTHYDRCIEVCTRFRFFDTEAANLTMRGLMRFYHNDFAGGIVDGEHAALLASRIGYQRAEVSAVLNCLCRVWTERGEIERARPELMRVRDIAQRLGMRRFEATSHVFLGRLLADRGERHLAEAELDAGLAMLRATGVAFMGPYTLGALARVTRDPGKRQAALEEAERLLAAGSASVNHLYFHRDAIELALAMGDPDLALAHADALERYTGDDPLPWSDFYIARGRALAANARDPRDPAARVMLAHLRRQARAIGFHVAATRIEDALERAPG
jgi:tetratricopeptide (TPR) repeat protein